MRTKKTNAQPDQGKNLECRLQFHFEGQVLNGVQVNGKITRTESFQATLIRGFNSRNVSIKKVDQGTMDLKLVRVQEHKEKYLRYSQWLDELNAILSQPKNAHDAQLIENKRILETELPKLKEALTQIDLQIAQLKEGARYGIQHQAMIHTTLEELDRPLRLATITGHFLDDKEVDQFSTLLYEDILHLKLINTQIGSKGAICLFEKLAANTTLRTLNLESNNVDDAAMQVFATNIAINTTLRAISFAKNPHITSACVPVLQEALAQNKTLYKISLVGTGLTATEIKSLTELVAKNAPKEPIKAPRQTYLSNWLGKTSSPEKTPLVKNTEGRGADIPMEQLDERSYK